MSCLLSFRTDLENCLFAVTCAFTCGPSSFYLGHVKNVQCNVIQSTNWLYAGPSCYLDGWLFADQ